MSTSWLAYARFYIYCSFGAHRVCNYTGGYKSMRNVMKNMVLPMLALLEDLENGAIRRERVFRERENLLANDDNWLISRFQMCNKVCGSY